MTPEEFKRRYNGTHTELQMLELARENKSLIKDSPGDKNIKHNHKIPGKALIESIEMEKRRDGLTHCLLDAVSTRAAEDLLLIPMDKLVALAIKSMPQKVDQKIEHEFTFADMVKKASVEVETYQTIDEEE